MTAQPTTEATAGFDDLRDRLQEFAIGDPAAYWDRVWLCPRCAYAEVPNPICPRGHEARRGWRADLRPAAAGATR